jgi:hypothetical protein
VSTVQLFVQPYPATGAKYQITNDAAAAFPVWSRDGKQIFYAFPPKLYVVDVRTQPTFSFGKPTTLPINGFFQPVPGQRNFDVAPDGKHLVVVMPASATQNENIQRLNPQINVVLNWFSELQQRVPVK